VPWLKGVSRWPISAEYQVRCQATPSGICGGQSDTVPRFLLVSIILSTCHTRLFICQWRYNISNWQGLQMPRNLRQMTLAAFTDWRLNAIYGNNLLTGLLRISRSTKNTLRGKNWDLFNVLKRYHQLLLCFWKVNTTQLNKQKCRYLAWSSAVASVHLPVNCCAVFLYAREDVMYATCYEGSLLVKLRLFNL
jgi:hypothetical protein